MKNLHITRLPTLVNVDKLTHAELRQQYQRLEGDAIDQAQQLSEVCAKLHQMNELAHNLSAVIYALCDSYDAGDQAAILLQVKKLNDTRNRANESRVH